MFVVLAGRHVYGPFDSAAQAQLFIKAEVFDVECRVMVLQDCEAWKKANPA